MKTWNGDVSFFTSQIKKVTARGLILNTRYTLHLDTELGEGATSYTLRLGLWDDIKDELEEPFVELPDCLDVGCMPDIAVSLRDLSELHQGKDVEAFIGHIIAEHSSLRFEKDDEVEEDHIRVVFSMGKKFESETTIPISTVKKLFLPPEKKPRKRKVTKKK